MKIKAALLTIGLLLFTTGAGIKEGAVNVVDYAKENNYTCVYYEEDDSEYADVDSYVLIYLDDGIAEYYDFANKEEAEKFKTNIVEDFSKNKYTVLSEDGLYENDGKYIKVDAEEDKLLYLYSSDANEIEKVYEDILK